MLPELASGKCGDHRVTTLIYPLEMMRMMKRIYVYIYIHVYGVGLSRCVCVGGYNTRVVQALFLPMPRGRESFFEVSRGASSSGTLVAIV